MLDVNHVNVSMISDSPVIISGAWLISELALIYS